MPWNGSCPAPEENDRLSFRLRRLCTRRGRGGLAFPTAALFSSAKATCCRSSAGGLLIAAAALAWPVRTKQAPARLNTLDEWMPLWQFGERHTIQIAAPPEEVFAAIRAVTADEIFLFQTLTAIRRCGRPGPADVLHPPGQQPLLDVATQTTFVSLSDDPPRELVVGTVIVAPAETRAALEFTPELFRGPLPAGVALAAMNFLVSPAAGGGSTLSTETRVLAQGRSSVRRFAVYWRMIHPGSDIIRRSWLCAIRRRAENELPAAIRKSSSR